MRVSLITVGGRELAALDVEPFWSCVDILQAFGHASPEVVFRLLHGLAELLPGQTLGSAGVKDGAKLTLVREPARLIVTASCDSTAKIWLQQTGDCLRTLQGHGRMVNTAAFSPNGTFVITASDDETAKIWLAETGDCVRLLHGHRD